jgi:hypothetical protein
MKENLQAIAMSILSICFYFLQFWEKASTASVFKFQNKELNLDSLALVELAKRSIVYMPIIHS